MGDELRWERDGADWPNRDASRFVFAAGMRWHVQQRGEGPALLLLHGTGGSTHSWRGLLPRLAHHFRVVAPDLPGHAFSAPARRSARTLPGLSRALAELLHHLDSRPEFMVGHSAGAAIACRMVLDGLVEPSHVLSLNGALLPLRRFGAPLFRPLARLLVANPLVPWWLARRARNPGVTKGLIRDTGSYLAREDLERYGQLMRCPSHVAAALGMMASWELEPLERDLRTLATRLTLIVGGRDRFIPPSDAHRIRRLVPHADIVTIADLGHLAHEERPDEISGLIVDAGAPGGPDGATRSAQPTS